jgi:hypothetical protein
MIKSIVFSFLFVMGIVCTIFGQSPATFDEAKELSAKQQKPILLEFFREE